MNDFFKIGLNLLFFEKIVKTFFGFVNIFWFFVGYKHFWDMIPR